MTLLICSTCPRYDLRASGRFATEFRRSLADAVGPDGPSIAFRGVTCLGGCPQDGVVALDGPGKARVRFTGIGPDVATALLSAANAYDASPSGHPGEWEVPAELAALLSSVTVKRAPN